jgi:predicted ester cyclase
MENNRIIIKNFVDIVLNQGVIDSVDQFVWDDGLGLHELKEGLRGRRAAFPDMHWTIEEQIAEGDKVVTRFEWVGTHRAEYFKVAATGRSVKVRGVFIHHLEGGKIKETFFIQDFLGLMMQLGAFRWPQQKA